MRAPFHDGSLHVWIGPSRALRGREGRLLRNCLGILDGIVRKRVIPHSRGIVYAKNIERRLIYEYVASLRDNTRYRTDGVANRRVAGHDQLSTQATRHFRIEGTRRSTNGNQRNR